MGVKYDNSGALFRNDRREEGSRQPEYSGNITVDGVEYWLSAWIKEGQKGKFFSLAVKPKQPKPDVSKPIDQDMNDEIPF